MIFQVSQSDHTASILALIIHSIHYFFQCLQCNYNPNCSDSRFVSTLQTMLNIKTSWRTLKKTVYSSRNVFLNFENQLYLYVYICIYVYIYIIYIYTCIHRYIRTYTYTYTCRVFSSQTFPLISLKPSVEISF